MQRLRTTRRGAASDNPLGPLDFVVSVLTVLLVGPLLLLTIFLFGGADGVSILGVGKDDACVEAPSHALGASRPDVGIRRDFPDVAARLDPRIIEVCDSSPTTSQLVAQSAGAIAEYAWFVGFLLLTRGLIRRARADGLFADAIPGSVRAIGWWLLGGSLMVTLAHAVLDDWLLATMMRRGEPDLLNVLDFNLAAIVAGFAVLSIARVLRHARDLREDVEGLV